MNVKHNGRPALVTLTACVFALRLFAAAAVQERPVLDVESDSLRLSVGAGARCLEFTDKATGVNYCPKPGAVFARVKKGERLFDATTAAQRDGRLVVEFAGAGVSAAFRIVGEKHSIAVEVLSVTGGGVEELLFANVPLTLKAEEKEPFAACALALNLQTDVRALPRAMSWLQASAYPRFGFAGAKVALIGCPQKELRRVMQAVVTAAPELPHSPVGGPWALDAEINRGSYLFADISERTADAWIKLALELGMKQINFNGMSRYGDAEPFPGLYPRGRAGLKAVVDKVHAAGLKAGLHSYAFLISKSCPWVTPVPDARLAKDATFTLAEPLDADSTMVRVSENTSAMSVLTGYFVQNSVTLQIDDELITYSEAGRAAPFGFTKCQRGVLGTSKASHAVGAKVHHLKEAYGHFVPDPDSTLLREVAARQAQVFNECGFDMINLDALDAEGVLGGAENGWHYGAKFVFELLKLVERPSLIETSGFHHHLWHACSWLGAWDSPVRGHKRFIDAHCAVNAADSRMFLPMHLGWWAMKTTPGPQTEPVFADDIEYLCGKAIGNNAGFSIQGVTPEMFAKSPVLQRLGEIMRQYETLRHEKRFSDKVRARLRVPGDEFTLAQSPDGSWQLQPAHYDKHVVESRRDETAAWSVTNAFASQPLRVRMEVLMSAEPYDSTNAVTMTEFAGAAEFADRVQAKGVTATLTPSSEIVKAGAASGLIVASNAGATRTATWAKFGKTFSPLLNLGGERSLGVWVHGDGQGEVLNFQLRVPEHVNDVIGEHYVVVDFKGWRYFELIESEGARFADYAWPYRDSYDLYNGQVDYKPPGGPVLHGAGLYSIYKARVDYTQLEQLNIWINNLPARGAVKCYISPVRATPLVKARLRNPRLTVGDRTLRLPVEMESGSCVEFNSPTDCKVFGPDGSLTQDVKITGEVPHLAAGANRLRFQCDEVSGVKPRVRITISTLGAPLAE